MFIVHSHEALVVRVGRVVVVDLDVAAAAHGVKLGAHGRRGLALAVVADHVAVARARPA